MLSRLIHRLWHEASGARAYRDENRPSRESLVLMYNTMWDGPVDNDASELPDGCRLTTDMRTFHHADAVVFHLPSLLELPARKPQGQLWVAWSMECEANYLQLRDPTYTSQFDLTMTYRLNADVVVTYATYYGTVGNLARCLRTRPAPKTADKLATLFISSGLNQSGRIEYATEIMRYLDVHSYGKALRNRDLPCADRGRPTKLDVIAGYKFDLSFENARAEDYVTEKFFDPLVAGVVPVYLGAPNIEQFAPGDNCFINASDFRSPKELAEYLLHLQQDDAAYAAYFAWKDRPFRPAFDALLDGQRDPPFTRLGRAIQARRGARS